MTNKAYTESDIKILDEREHILFRPNVYIGSNIEEEYPIPTFNEKFEIKLISFIPGKLKIIHEIIDNSIDEHAQTENKKLKTIDIKANNETAEYTISDNGRGVPIGKHESGKHTPEVVFSSLRSGRNFTDNKAAGVLGQNGLGSVLCNVLSEQFEVTIRRDGKEYYQKFEDSVNIIHPPKIKKISDKKTGTCISFKIKSDFFTTNLLSNDVVRERANIIAATNPNMKVSYNNEVFLYKDGMSGLLKKYFTDLHKFGNATIEFFIVKDQPTTPSNIFTWVNSSMLYDGGMCNTQLVNAFVDKTISHLEKQAKKRKIIINRADVLEGILFFANFIVSDPTYDSQAKTKLTGPNLRKDIDLIMEEGWSKFARANNNRDWFSAVIDRAVARSNASATKAAAAKQKKHIGHIENFMEANSKKRSQCRLLITEGNSAKANIVQSRNPSTDAAYPLTGKINNTYSSSVAELLKMGKVTTLLNIIGLIPGKKAIRSELRYGKICLSCDSDIDGYHIALLLIALFRSHWPELFDPNYPPIVYLMKAPNVVVSNGKKRIHIPSLSEFERVSKKYSGWDVEYMKGLGSMQKVDWDMILNDADESSFFPIIDDGKLDDILKLLFSDDIAARKKWLVSKVED